MTSLVTPSQRLFGVTLVPPVRGAAVDRLRRLREPDRPDAQPVQEVRVATEQQRRDAAPSGAPRVALVAWTQFAAPEGLGWDTDAEGGQALAEFAGRACYQSWDKPNPATATNAGYLRHLLDVGHLAALEHATATFYLTRISRSLGQELVRHRHLSFSQLSQRQAPEPGELVEPDVIRADPQLHATFTAATDAAARAYDELLAGLEQRLAGTPDATLRRKQARQAARSVLPGASETRLVASGNYRAWRHFVAVRASEHADVEIRAVAVAVLRQLQRLAPNAFGDFTITRLPDGTEVASSPLATEG